VPIRGIDHVDLAVADVQRSLDFYLEVFGPLGADVALRYSTYRGTEEVVYLRLGEQYLGFRSADGGQYRYYDVGIEHLAVTVDSRAELDGCHERARKIDAKIQFPPEEDRDIPGVWEMFVFDPDGIRVEVAYYPPGTVR
jgi:catechol 2,3-dioxygenase-like lactoylglutathione lyase family enzyme